MSLLNEYYEQRKQPPTDLAKRILFKVIDDILGRSGFDGAWDEIDGPEIKEEIFQTNLKIIQKEISQ